jgi:hypothetical protein
MTSVTFAPPFYAAPRAWHDSSFGPESFDRAALALNEAETDEFAARLIDTRSEAQFDHLLGAILTHAAARGGGSLSPMIGSALGGLLKSIALQDLGRRTTAQAIGLELEGLEGMEREFETALQFVRLAAEAARHAVEEPPIAPSRPAAHAALAAASDIYAPPLTSYIATDEGRFGSGAGLRAAFERATADFSMDRAVRLRPGDGIFPRQICSIGRSRSRGDRAYSQQSCRNRRQSSHSR